MRSRIIFLFFFCVFWTNTASAQDKKVVTAVRTQNAIQIDGILNESSWLLSDFVSDFVELKPNPGQEPGSQSCIKVLYDDTGIYIGAELDEKKMEELGKELFERDNLDDDKKIDWFGVVVDCYQNGLNGYGFVVSASGVQTDIKFSSYGDDESWDAVWDSEISIHDNFWTCEIQIPFNALRFPNTEAQHWGIQFGRRSYQRQEESFWNPIDPGQDGFLTQSGTLEGIQDIKPPARFSATPFLAGYAENYYDPASSHKSSWGTSYNAGMDIKYGISDAYTLDMTLIPDFGQVQSDNEVLNLSPFEVQFDENRQFFNEGTELFTRANLFYSRRVGGTPYYYDQVYDGLNEDESVSSIKSDSRLINATKISGRNKSGMGLGYFNAVSPRDHAIVKNTLSGMEHAVLLQPWTNYNVMVLDQNLKNNSYVSLINTNVWREGSATDANVTGIEFDLRNKQNKYGLAGNAAIDHKWNAIGDEIGYKYKIEIAKHSGNLTWELGHRLQSDTYDINDLGYNERNNSSTWNGFVEYNKYKAFGPFLNASVGTFAQYSSLYRFPGAPEDQFRSNLFTSAGIDTWVNGLFKNFYQVNLSMYMQPFKGYDYFEPRVPGRFFEYPAFKNISLNASSDSRKKLRMEGRISYTAFHEKNKYKLGFEIESKFRLNNHFSVGYEFEHEFLSLDRGYITEIENDIVFGGRDYRDLTQLVEANYTFNPKMSLSFRLRHNWTRVQYTNFYTLLENGTIEDRVYDQNEDINYNAWTIDTNFRWRFAPGSDLFIVWKNSIFGENDQSMISFSDNLADLFRYPTSNSFSIKAIYYIDFQEWK